MHEKLMGWLQDAYAMERGVEETLERHLRDVEDMPDMRMRMQDHLDETRRQAERLREHIEAKGGDISKAREITGSVLGTAEGLMNKVMPDTPLKNMLADYALEQYEVASYRSLVAAAEELGEAETAALAQELLREEEQMARWFEDQIDTVTRLTLSEAKAA
jgi:ferritin-like metal-binding protein YciE